MTVAEKNQMAVGMLTSCLARIATDATLNQIQTKSIALGGLRAMQIIFIEDRVPDSEELIDWVKTHILKPLEALAKTLEGGTVQ